MCYPQPGPRCSGHARARLDIAWARNRTLRTPESQLLYLQARDGFDETPAGLAALRTQASRLEGQAGAVLLGRYDSALARRDAAFAAYRAKNGVMPAAACLVGDTPEVLSPGVRLGEKQVEV